ncbi:hypothetical protein HN992_03025 [Candidatus Woesearchaeota archaeon]|jgi:hypothetical protein|nr:hypothetical protein [Candidatus Woesearchaeota archaeon]MBT3438760.1 hypothetical protein [Candidatus Woesearchaeota archaeon]MBT4058457.1 hypothetical protein [Candidatus Woesearchaeota archaeon]MBT4208754.1 hypothetical protein [Candidatus Woesearchaeota archaeon]MBT4733157.1 hypothetical protein [Candidatus Woesearchaeota archaeon]
MATKEIAFIYNKELEKLNDETSKILFNIQHPLAGKNIHLLKTFTRELIKAHSKKSRHKIKRDLPEDALVFSNNDLESTFLDLDIPLPELEPSISPEELISTEIDRLVDLTESSPERIPLGLPDLEPETLPLFQNKQEEKIIQIPTEKTPLITSSITDEVMAAGTKNGMFFIIEETELSKGEIKVLNALKPRIIKKESLLSNKNKFTKLMEKQAKKHKVDVADLSPSKMRYFLIKHIINFGLIDPLFHDQLISKIICDGPSLKIRIVRNNERLITNLEYGSNSQLNNFLIKLAKKTKNNLTEDHPFFEAQLDNFKIHGTLGTSGIPTKYTIERLI